MYSEWGLFLPLNSYWNQIKSRLRGRIEIESRVNGLLIFQLSILKEYLISEIHHASQLFSMLLI